MPMKSFFLQDNLSRQARTTQIENRNTATQNRTFPEGEVNRGWV